jgi:hypothetical protein
MREGVRGSGDKRKWCARLLALSSLVLFRLRATQRLSPSRPRGTTKLGPGITVSPGAKAGPSLPAEARGKAGRGLRRSICVARPVLGRARGEARPGARAPGTAARPVVVASRTGGPAVRAVAAMWECEKRRGERATESERRQTGKKDERVSTAPNARRVQRRGARETEATCPRPTTCGRRHRLSAGCH